MKYMVFLLACLMAPPVFAQAVPPNDAPSAQAAQDDQASLDALPAQDADDTEQRLHSYSYYERYAYDHFVGYGERVIFDNRIWSCKELSEEELIEIDNLDLDVINLNPNPASSCIVRNTKGNPAFLRKRYVLGDSILITYHDKRNVTRKQSFQTVAEGWEKIPGDIGIELPLVRNIHKIDTWPGLPEDMPGGQKFVDPSKQEASDQEISAQETSD